MNCERPAEELELMGARDPKVKHFRITCTQCGWVIHAEVMPHINDEAAIDALSLDHSKNCPKKQKDEELN